MRITINEKKKSFTFEVEGLKQEVKFSDVTESDIWKESGIISIKHEVVNEYGNHPVTTLNKEAFTANMLHGDDEYMKYRGAYELNTAIHKLYAILEGKTEKDAELEIDNVCQQRRSLDDAKRQWANEQVERIYQLEIEAASLEDREEVKSKLEEIKAIKMEEPPFLVSREMKKIFFAARDESAPNLTLKNVTPAKVEEHYGDSLKVV